MRNHRRDRVLIGGNVRLEVVHESNPFFAGEPICLVVRLKHLGSSSQHELLESKIQSLEAEIAGLHSRSENSEVDRPWIMQTLWKTLHQEEKYNDESLQLQIDELNSKKKFHEPVELLSCFVQILGQFSFDGSNINESALNSEQKAHTLIGVDSKEMSHEGMNSSDISLQSFFNTSVRETMTKARNVMSTELVEMETWTKLPIFLVPQTLLFSELILYPGETRLFKFRAEDIPENLCPTYTHSSHFNISYLCQVGLTLVESTNRPTQHFNNFPIFLQPYVNENLCQYEIPLSKGLRIAEQAKVLEVTHAFRPTKTNKLSVSSTKSLWPLRRRSSYLLEEGELSQVGPLKQKFKEVAFTWNQNEDPDVPIETILDSQFSKTKAKEVFVRETLMQLYEGELRPNISAEYDDPALYKQLKTPQKEFIVNMNEKFICKVRLSKTAYSVTDQIDLCLDFKSDNSLSHYKVTAVTACLETFELLNPEYAIDENMTKKRPSGTPIYEANFTNFDMSDKLRMKLLPQCTPTALFTSQFKTDLFQLKWMISFKFVMLPVSSDDEDLIMNMNYVDKKGISYHAKQHLDGYQFVFHIPINVLPTEKQLGGW